MVTPINVSRLEFWLRESKYDKEKTEELIEEFTNGFDLGYRGTEHRQDYSENIPLRIGSKTELWNKTMKEVELGRYAGPYDKVIISYNRQWD